ncbi:MAG: response regulator [Rhodothermales bacterium]
MLEKEQLIVLVIEDDEDDYFIVRRLLAKTTGVQCNLDWARTYEEGLQRLTARCYDVALVDYRLDAHDGLELLRKALELGCETPMILLTGQGDLQVDLEAMAAGAADYLVKGQIDSQLLERSIRYARERKRADERIREQAAFLEKARDAISAYDLDMRVIYWNRSAESMTGYLAGEMLGKRADAELYEGHSGLLQEAWETVHLQGEWTGELRQRTKSGDQVIVESRWTLVRDTLGNPKSVLVINTDITERKELETQFLRSQRMESVGTLVGGIAHDLGNLLVPVLLGVQVLEKRYEDDASTIRTLEMIGRSAQRGADMVKKVLAFARGVEGERVPLEAGKVVGEVERLTTETFPQHIEVDVHVEKDLWMIRGDATQVQQVLMNLAVNARDAMPEGGLLKITASNVEIGDEHVRLNIEAKKGPYVRLCVSDVGTGIPQEVLNKMFEPFFTTKPSGKGTGLGLSTVYSIVKSHKGFMNVQSKVGKGTRFEIYLPAIREKINGRASENTAQSVKEGNDEVVLVADDEPFVLELTKDTLEGAGYQVLTARHGAEALQLFEERLDIRVVITDLMMPEIDGISAIRIMKAQRPDVPVIAASGASGDTVTEAMKAGADSFLSKPFTADKICRVLSEVIEPRRVSNTA